MLNRALVGKRYPATTYEVTAEAIHRYAEATNDPGPAAAGQDPIAPVAFPCVVGIDHLNRVMYDPELGVDMAMLVHASQEHILHGPIRAGARLEVQTVLADVDLAETGHTFTVATSLNAGSEPLAEARSVLFIRRTGTVKAPAPPAPVRGEPLFEAAEEVAGDQAVRYADASGDHNPIHLDREAARAAGFPGPILHGMCTMAFACKALVAHLAAGDPALVGSVRVEFSRPVFPGQALITRAWKADSGKPGSFEFETVNPRGAAVLKAGRVEIVDSR